jgi:hypothetical protein
MISYALSIEIVIFHISLGSIIRKISGTGQGSYRDFSTILSLKEF